MNDMLASVTLERTDRCRWKHWLARAAICFLAAPIIAGAILAMQWPFSQVKVTEALQEVMPGSVQFRTFHSTYLPNPGCVAEGVVFTRRGHAPDAQPLFTIERIRIQAGYLDLFTRRGYVTRIVLEGLHVRIPPRGATSAEETSEQAQRQSKMRIGTLVADGSVLEIARKGKKESLQFEIHTLTLNSVSSSGPMAYRVAVRNPLPQGEIVSSGRFGPWNPHETSQTPLSGSYTFKRADLGVFGGISGMLSSNGEFSGPLGHIATQGNIEIPDFSVTRSKHAVPLQAHFHAFVDGENGDVSLQSVEAYFLRTGVVGSGNIAGKPDGHGKTTSVDITVNDGRIQDVLRLFVREQRPPFSGTTGFRAHITIPPGPAPFLKKVRLTGEFGVGGGHFTKSDTQRQVAQLSERARGEKQKEIEQEDPRSIISHLAGKVSLQGGTAIFSQLSFTVPGAQAQMHGTYNVVNERIDLHGTLKTDAPFTTVTGGGVKSIFLKPFDMILKGKPKGATIPVHLIGTYSDAHPGLDIVSRGK